MSKVYIARPFSTDTACLKIVNDSDKELSIAFDDSCGKLRDLARNSVCLYDNASSSKLPVEVEYGVTPEELLAYLANHLGYTVHKNPLTSHVK
jgi:hypothetical protein